MRQFVLSSHPRFMHESLMTESFTFPYIYQTPLLDLDPLYWTHNLLPVSSSWCESYILVTGPSYYPTLCWTVGRVLPALLVTWFFRLEYFPQRSPVILPLMCIMTLLLWHTSGWGFQSTLFLDHPFKKFSLLGIWDYKLVARFLCLLLLGWIFKWVRVLM